MPLQVFRLFLSVLRIEIALINVNFTPVKNVFSDHARFPIRRVYFQLTGQFADKPNRGKSSRGLDNSRTSQLADSEFLKIMELLYFICTLNLALTLILSNIGSV